MVLALLSAMLSADHQSVLKLYIYNSHSLFSCFIQIEYKTGKGTMYIMRGSIFFPEGWGLLLGGVQGIFGYLSFSGGGVRGIFSVISLCEF